MQLIIPSHPHFGDLSRIINTVDTILDGVPVKPSGLKISSTDFSLREADDLIFASRLDQHAAIGYLLVAYKLSPQIAQRDRVGIMRPSDSALDTVHVIGEQNVAEMMGGLCMTHLLELSDQVLGPRSA